MYRSYPKYPCSYYDNTPQYSSDTRYGTYNDYHCPYYNNMRMDDLRAEELELKDYGPKPFAINIAEATKQNDNFRTALWTGKHLQLTLMSIPVGGEIGLEIHPNIDQFIRIEEGEGLVKMGNSKDNLDFQERVHDDFIFIVPAGTWHNLVNTGNVPIKLYSIYAPPQHPFGTVHKTKADAEEAEAEESHRYRHQYRQGSHRQIRNFTSRELAYFDGTMGKPAYVAINGIVYDVGHNQKWREAMYRGLVAGRDLTSQVRNYHELNRQLSKIPKVGRLKG